MSTRDAESGRGSCGSAGEEVAEGEEGGEDMIDSILSGYLYWYQIDGVYMQKTLRERCEVRVSREKAELRGREPESPKSPAKSKHCKHWRSAICSWWHSMSNV